MRKKGEAPAFLFDVDAWLTSVKIAMMTAEQERGYLRLLLYQWKDPQCRLPDDDSILAVLSKMDEGWLNGGSTVVRSCFKAKDGFLVNERLFRERERWNTWQQKSSEGGKRSVQVRRQQRLSKGGSTTAQPPSQHEKENGNSKENTIPPNGGPKRPNLWDVGVGILIEAGDTEKKARTFLGSLTKDYGKSLMAEAVAKMSAAGPVAEPHAYLKALLRGSKGSAQISNDLTPEQRQLGESRYGKSGSDTSSC